MDKAVRYTPCTRGHKVELSEDGEVVCSSTIHDYEMRIGDTWVRMGGIGSVNTKPKNRGKGYARRMLNDAVRFMRAEGYAVSTLFGIGGFYHRFGYAPVLLGKSEVRVETRAAERLQGGLKVRRAEAEDGAALLGIYETTIGGGAGAIRRKAPEFIPVGEAIDDWSVERLGWVAEHEGRPVAYALAEPEWQQDSDWRRAPYEVAVLPEFVGTAGPSLLGALGADAAERRVEYLKLETLPDAPVLQVLRPSGYEIALKYTGNQGGMGRIVSLAALAETLTPTLERRTERLDGKLRVGTLSLDCGDERAVIDLGDGPDVELRLPQDALLQLVMGYRSIDELRLAYPECVDAAAALSLAGLFPPGYPYTWAINHF